MIHRDPVGQVLRGGLRLLLLLWALGCLGYAAWRAWHLPPLTPLPTHPVLLTCVQGTLWLETPRGSSPLTLLPQDREIPTTLVLLVNGNTGSLIPCAWQSTDPMSSCDRLGAPGRSVGFGEESRRRNSQEPR